MENSYHKLSELRIKCQKGESRDFLKELYFTAPFKVMKPFYDENNQMSVMILSVSAGIMAGDRQKIDLTVCENSNITVSSQSYEKIHKMAIDTSALRETEITVEKGGYLNYSPLPTIPFENSAFTSNTNIRLTDKSSKLAFSEIISCGRVGCGEKFDYTFYKSLTKIWVSDELIYHDNANYKPAESDMNGLCLFENYTHLSNLLLINFSDANDKISEIREILSSETDIKAGASLTASGDICVKILGYESEQLLKINKKILSI